MYNSGIQKIKLGNIGENLACGFLQKRGFVLVKRNLRVGRWGEADLVMLDGGILVFVEVKTRTSMFHGRPEEAVDYYKIRTLKRLVYKYCQLKNWKGCVRIDVVSISISPRGPVITHFVNVSV